LTEGGVRPFHVAELAGALGTLELGQRARAARRLFEQSLIEPTDNSVAQAVWASRAITSLNIEKEHLNAPTSFEARARHLARLGDWREAVDESWGWLFDEPYSSEAAVFGSYEAAAGEDYEGGIRIAQEATQANPRDFLLFNNLAFCLGNLGRTKEGHDYLKRFSLDSLEPDQQPFLLATRGLLAFRDGSLDEGRSLYRAALERSKEPSVRGLAMIMFAREEVLAGTPAGHAVVEAALTLGEEVERGDSGAVSGRDLTLWLRQLRRLLASGDPATATHPGRNR
jgi:tetratricopeptide (TPR) repeat protein